jgi:hypothetical protein
MILENAYVNLRWSKGNVYENLGFKKISREKHCAAGVAVPHMVDAIPRAWSPFMSEKFPRLSLPNWAVNVDILQAIHDHICDVQLVADDLMCFATY